MLYVVLHVHISVGPELDGEVQKDKAVQYSL
jgi:hypothetical protein